MRNIYMEDRYLNEVQTVILQSRLVKKRTALELRENIFYPGGGGQPSDTGYLFIGDKRYEVLRAVNIDGISWVCLDTKDEFADGEPVSAHINWERRYLFMRAHTAAHVVMCAIKNNVREYSTGGIDINENGSGDIELDFYGIWDATDETAEKIIRQSNEMIQQDGQVYPENFPCVTDAVSKYETIFRGSTDAKGAVQIIVIDGLDANPCGGTHVKKLSEIGNIRMASHTHGSINIHIDQQFQ